MGLTGPLIGRQDRLGARSGESEDLQTLRRIWKTTLGVAAPLSLVFAVIFAVTGAQLAAILMVAQGVFWLTLLLLFALIGRHLGTFAFLSQAFLVISSFVSVVSLGGPIHSGGWILLGLMGPFYALVFPYPRRAVWLLCAWLGTVALEVMLIGHVPWAQPLPQNLNLVSFLSVVCVFSLFVMVTLFYFIHERNRAFRLLDEERNRSENLLLNILPREIASILKGGNRVIAVRHASASVLFADLVGFTPLSSGMTPEELVALLNEVFTAIDELVEKRGLEKIKTIGDCYMAAAGVPRPRQDHAQELVRLALDIRDLAVGREFGRRRLSFRIGLNSGPLVAGVIGRQKFIYDLWGDVVNTASRMESHGQPGAIHITRETYELIREEFLCQSIGPVSVKGKGEMEVWRVDGEMTTEPETLQKCSMG